MPLTNKAEDGTFIPSSDLDFTGVTNIPLDARLTSPSDLDSEIHHMTAIPSPPAEQPKINMKRAKSVSRVYQAYVPKSRLNLNKTIELQSRQKRDAKPASAYHSRK